MNKDKTQNTAEKVLQYIKEQDTKPHSRPYFIVRNIIMWSLAAATLLLGALAISSIIFRLSNIASVLPPGAPQLQDSINWLELMPFIWVVALAIFGYLAYREIRATKKGYKYELSTLLLIMVFASGVAGVALYSAGSGYVLDKAASRVMPFHRDIELIQQNTWMRPENGFLVGEIVELNETSMTLNDPKGSEWLVTYGEDLQVNEDIEVGQRVGLRGVVEENDESTFYACGMRSLEFRGQGIGSRPPRDPEFNPRVSKNEIIENGVRNSKCEGVRP